MPTVQLAFPVQGQSRRQTNKNGTQKFQAVKANKYSKSNNIMLAAAGMAKLRLDGGGVDEPQRAAELTKGPPASPGKAASATAFLLQCCLSLAKEVEALREKPA